MRIKLVLALLLSSVTAASALAGTSAMNPAAMVLRKADMPAGAQYELIAGDDTDIGDALVRGGVTAEAASYLGSAYSKVKGFQQISGVVFALPSRAQAIKAFGLVTKHRAAWWKRLGTPLKPVTAPRYGDQQVVGVDPPGSEGVSLFEAIVRRNRVVWVLWVKREKRPTLPMADLTAEFKSYAAKQQRRVGRG